MSRKRKLGEITINSSACDLQIVDGTTVAHPMRDILFGRNSEQRRAIAACCRAVVKSPTASRAAFKKYRASVDFFLARTLLIVGDYDLEVSPTIII